MLPFFARDFGISLDAAGLLLTVLFTGSIGSSGLVAWRLAHRDPRRLGVVGVVISALGVAGLGWAPNFACGLAAASLVGAGDGLVIAAVHQLMAETSENVSAGINRLNVFFALGAVVGPLWTGIILKWSDERWPVYAGILAAMMVALFVIASAKYERTGRIKHAAAGGSRERHWNVAVAMGGVLFLYVGAEIGLGSWVASYAKEAVGAGIIAGALLTSAYWGALAAGRVTSGWLFARGRSGLEVLLVTLVGAVIATIVLAITTGNPATAAIAAVCTGLCFGPIWPAAMGIAAERGVAGGAASMVTAGNAGGIAIPFVQGLVLVSSGPRLGISVTAALCVAMLCVATAFRVRTQPARA
jgi:MFS transporter, FHS family, glucose/mannose:H+ symporter